MTHPRTQIRSAFVTYLGQNTAAAPAPAAYRTAAGPRVFKGRLMPIEEPELPAIVVHTREPEEILERSAAGRDGFEKRRCIVSVVCVAQTFDDIDADLDAIAAQIEDALNDWAIPNFEASAPELLDTRSEDPDFDGALTTGATMLRYAVDYLTPRSGIDHGLWDSDYPSNCPAPGISSLTARAHHPEGSVDFSQTVIGNGD